MYYTSGQRNVVATTHHILLHTTFRCPLVQCTTPIEDVERGAELSFSGPLPLRGPLTSASRTLHHRPNLVFRGRFADPSSGRKCRVGVNAAHFSEKSFSKFENMHGMHLHFDTPPTTNGPQLIDFHIARVTVDYRLTSCTGKTKSTSPTKLLSMDVIRRKCLGSTA